MIPIFSILHSSFFIPRFPLTSEQAVEVHVIAPAVALKELTVGALALEAELLIERDSGRVVAEDCQLDAMQIQLAEGEVERQPQRLGAVALAAPHGLADADAQPAA